MKNKPLRMLARQTGQATVEFVVCALVLVPLFIAVPLVGKYIDMMQATEAASRYVAFEGAARNSSSAWKSDAQLAVEVRRRFFSAPGAPLKTDDVAGDFAADRNPLWTDHGGRPLLPNFAADVGVRTTVADAAAIPELAAIFRASLGLSNANFYTASVFATPAPIANFAPFDTVSMAMTRKTVLLADAWTARDTSQVRGRVEGSAAAFPIGQLSGVIDVAGLLPSLLLDPSVGIGPSDWDTVPCDRLIGGC
jgi:hypothetical protein